MDKFLGLGLTKLLAIWLLFVLFSAGAKIIATQHHVPGVSELILAGA